MRSARKRPPIRRKVRFILRTECKGQGFRTVIGVFPVDVEGNNIRRPRPRRNGESVEGRVDSGIRVERQFVFARGSSRDYDLERQTSGGRFVGKRDKQKWPFTRVFRDGCQCVQRKE